MQSLRVLGMVVLALAVAVPVAAVQQRENKQVKLLDGVVSPDPYPVTEGPCSIRVRNTERVRDVSFYLTEVGSDTYHKVFTLSPRQDRPIANLPFGVYRLVAQREPNPMEGGLTYGPRTIRLRPGHRKFTWKLVPRR